MARSTCIAPKSNPLIELFGVDASAASVDIAYRNYHCAISEVSETRTLEAALETYYLNVSDHAASEGVNAGDARYAYLAMVHAWHGIEL